MAYSLQAFIGRRAALERHARAHAHIHVVGLRQGFALIPCTDELLAELGDSDEELLRLPLLIGDTLPEPLAAWGRSISAEGMAAYAEVVCFGGPCDQVAIVWDMGQIALGPLRYGDDTYLTRIPGSIFRDGALNRALRALGAERGWAPDEFDTLGFGRDRRTVEDWVTEGDVDDSPVAEADGPWVEFRRGQGRWAGMEPTVEIDFRPNSNVIAATRAAGTTRTLDLGSDGPLHMPMRLTVDGKELLGDSTTPWQPMPLVHVAGAGLACLRWAARGADSLLTINTTSSLMFMVRGGVVSVHVTGSRRWEDVPYVDLLSAWETFARRVHWFLLDQLPELRDHPTIPWFRDDPLAVESSFAPPPVPADWFWNP